jgi:mono/diheme cytochrome c family protein
MGFHPGSMACPRIIALAAMLITGLVGCQPEEAVTQSAQQRIERGRYLVENVAMCADCHSPRDETGAFIASKHLQGTVLDFEPSHEMPDWAAYAPPIAGLPGHSIDEAVTFLSTGAMSDGSRCRPPHPSYRMTNDDAQAVVAFLKSLQPAG